MSLSRTLLLVLSLISILGCSQRNISFDHDCSYTQSLAPVDEAAEQGAVFLFGERHGTVEAPSFVANFACKIAQDTQEPLIVLLELPIPEILSDLSAKAMPIDQAQSLVLEAGRSYWSSGHDGRTSEAMMAAILQILRLREKGLDIALGSSYPDEEKTSGYFDVNLNESDKTVLKNRYFQEAIQILTFKEIFKNVIVLNGSNHIRKHLEFYSDMGVEIPHMGFIQAYGGGTEWNCQSAAGGCKIHETTPRRKTLVEASDDASLVLLGGEYKLFDGVFAFKTITASSPYLDDLTSK